LDELLPRFTEKKLADDYLGDFEDVHERFTKLAEERARVGFSAREAALYIFDLKAAILEILQQDAVAQPLVSFNISLRLTKLLDSFATTVFEAFINSREQAILRQTDEIAQLATPVIHIWAGVVALPIIGTLDSSRTQEMLENLLQEMVKTNSSIAILDISGVPAVDSMVAQHLVKTVSATRLTGGECIISGIRPEIALTVVQLGIGLPGIITKASLASALQHAFSLLDLYVAKRVVRAGGFK
jgi:rsbT co-antagonist protein RsbR